MPRQMLPAPPRTLDELLERARALAGASVDSLAWALREEGVGAGTHSKGKVGELIERVLGARGGSAATWDYPELEVELKTVPVNERGRPLESTFVCTVSLLEADRAEWETSWVRAKLARVLWVPIVRTGDRRHVGAARLWSPSAEEDRVLKDDFDEIMGAIGIGAVEGVSARVGRWLQLRPKAAHGAVRTPAPGRDGDDVRTVPRGFYLRAVFTATLLRGSG